VPERVEWQYIEVPIRREKRTYRREGSGVLNRLRDETVEGWFGTVNGQEVLGLTNILNSLGEMSWELVAVLEDERGMWGIGESIVFPQRGGLKAAVLVLKRPRVSSN
jgi:hypothetical protein